MDTNELIIDDSYDVTPDQQSGRCGTKPRTCAPGSLTFAPIPDLELIPRNEWSERIKDLKESGSLLSQVSTREGIPCLNQKQTSFCHAFSPTLAIMILRAVQRQEFALLSPASIAGPVTGFRNEGAYIADDLRQITTGGVATQVFVPPTQIAQSGFKPGWKEDALQYRVVEWWDLGHKNGAMFDRVMTILLSGLPVCVAYNWWGHAVTLVDPVELSPGKFGVRFRNSWGDAWPNAGANGYALLPEGKGTPDEAYAPRSIILSNNAA